LLWRAASGRCSIASLRYSSAWADPDQRIRTAAHTGGPHCGPGDTHVWRMCHNSLVTRPFPVFSGYRPRAESGHRPQARRCGRSLPEADRRSSPLCVGLDRPSESWGGLLPFAWRAFRQPDSSDGSRKIRRSKILIHLPEFRQAADCALYAIGRSGAYAAVRLGMKPFRNQVVGPMS
jgi:hypothetical protein